MLCAAGACACACSCTGTMLRNWAPQTVPQDTPPMATLRPVLLFLRVLYLLGVRQLVSSHCATWEHGCRDALHLTPSEGDLRAVARPFLEDCGACTSSTVVLRRPTMHAVILFVLSARKGDLRTALWRCPFARVVAARPEHRPKEVEWDEDGTLYDATAKPADERGQTTLL